MRSTSRLKQHCTSSSRMAFGNGASRATDPAELARRSSLTAIPSFVQNKKLAPTANERARGLVVATHANVLEGKDMHTDEKRLRALVDKWLEPGAARTARVMEFSRTLSDRRRYVPVGAFPREASFSIVFFRHDDGSWNPFQERQPCRRCMLAG
jgi:hypothetical protein